MLAHMTQHRINRGQYFFGMLIVSAPLLLPIVFTLLIGSAASLFSVEVESNILAFGSIFIVKFLWILIVPFLALWFIGRLDARIRPVARLLIIIVGTIVLGMGAIAVLFDGLSGLLSLMNVSYLVTVAGLSALFFGILWSVWRLHDIGASGWWFLAVLVIPFISLSLSVFDLSPTLAAVLQYAQVGPVLVLLIASGTRGPN